MDNRSHSLRDTTLTHEEMNWRRWSLASSTCASLREGRDVISKIESSWDVIDLGSVNLILLLMEKRRLDNFILWLGADFKLLALTVTAASFFNLFSGENIIGLRDENFILVARVGHLRLLLIELFLGCRINSTVGCISQSFILNLLLRRLRSSLESTDRCSCGLLQSNGAPALD